MPERIILKRGALQNLSIQRKNLHAKSETDDLQPTRFLKVRIHDHSHQKLLYVSTVYQKRRTNCLLVSGTAVSCVQRQMEVTCSNPLIFIPSECYTHREHKQATRSGGSHMLSIVRNCKGISENLRKVKNSHSL